MIYTLLSLMILNGAAGGGGGGTPPKKNFTIKKAANSPTTRRVFTSVSLCHINSSDFTDSCDIYSCNSFPYSTYIQVISKFLVPLQGWRIVRATNEQRGAHFRFYNTDFSEGPLFRAALGNAARTNGDGFVWDKVDRYWWVSIANAATYIGGAGGADLTEDNITAELLEEVVRFADLKPPADT